MTTDDQYPRPDPDQLYEDWIGLNLIEEHERHPERFKTVTTPRHEFPCTDCGGDAYLGMSEWSGPQGVIIAASERLCMPCAKKRGVGNPFEGAYDCSRPPTRDTPKIAPVTESST